MVNAVIGGMLIGVAAVWLMLSIGRIAGVSGVLAAAVTRRSGVIWAALFIVGIGIGGALGSLLVEVPVVRSLDLVTWPLLVGGLLVGFGTRLGAGCTSGHGVCGIARISPRSIVATLTFLAIGVLTASLVHA